MMRIGIGYDIHTLVPHRPLVLGGLVIPHPKGQQAHSDGDVICHALCDAMLGAAGLPNIGELFPDTDPNYKDCNSMDLLSAVVLRLEEAGYAPAQVDANVIAQSPRLQPYLGQMRQNVADRLHIGVDCVSIKPRTNEGVGPEGRGEAVSAQAVALILKKV